MGTSHIDTEMNVEHRPDALKIPIKMRLCELVGQNVRTTNVTS